MNDTALQSNIKKHILFFEENSNDEKEFNKLIRKEGLSYTFLTVSSAPEAIRELESDNFDIIIADYDFICELSIDVCNMVSHKPIIIMISMEKSRHTDDFCNLGSCDLLLKDAQSRHVKYLPVAIENALKHAKLEEELTLAKEAANAANRSKTEFLANMTHELRTPLNAILGFSEMMAGELAGKVNKTQKAFLQDINESGHLLLSLINDILDLSKIEAGKIELDYSLIDINGLIERSELFIRGEAMSKAIKISKKIPDQNIKIHADEIRIKQVLVNLLGNAVKFTPENGVITIYVEKKGDFIQIAIHDTGMGIKSEDIPKLFLPFKQLESDHDTKKQGTGLGLALCKKIIELHGGKIWIESEWKKWCKFIFTLPCQNK